MKQDADLYLYPANIKVAKAHLEESSIRDPYGRQYKCCAPRANVFSKLSIGVKLYFRFQLQMCILFAVLTILTVPELVFNLIGGYYDPAKSSYLELTTIAEQPGIKAGETNSSAVDEAMSKQKIGKYVTIYTSIVVAAVFMLVVGILDIKNKQYIDADTKNSQMPYQYSIKVEGIPRKSSPRITEEEVKNHFQKNYGDVIECVFAKSFLGCMELYKEKSDLKKLITIEKKALIIKKQETSSSLEKLLAKAKIIKEKLTKKLNGIGGTYDDLPTLHALVTFNSLADKAKLMDEYTKSCLWPKKLYLRDTYKLKVSEPDNPSDIKWENLDVSCCSKFCRAVCTVFFVILLLALSIAAMFAIQNSTNKLPSMSSCIVYDMSFDIADLETHISAQPTVNQTEFKNCYCSKQSMFQMIYDTKYTKCQSYMILLGKTWGIKVGGMIALMIVNVLLEILMEVMAKFKKFSTTTAETVSLTTLIFITALINNVVIILFINANFSIYGSFSKIKQNKVGNFFFGGNYIDFNREWYVKIGTSFIILGVVNMLVPHVVDVLVKKPLNAILRCCCACPGSRIQ